MNTHILISIKEYNKIANLPRGDKEDTEKLEAFEVLFGNAKLISLHGGDINKKAKEAFNKDNREYECAQMGYKRALTDLLKDEK